MVLLRCDGGGDAVSCFLGLNDMSARLQQLNDNYQRQHRINAELTERSRNLYRRHVSRASAHLPPSHVNPFDDYDPPDLQSMNRNVADAFMSRGGVGEPAVSSSIGSITHRIQRWDLNRRIPDIFAPKVNMVLRSCKLHNDATADISQDGRYLATFVSTSRGLPDDTMLGVFSLQSHNLGQCLYTKSFGTSIGALCSPQSSTCIFRANEIHCISFKCAFRFSFKHTSPTRT